MNPVDYCSFDRSAFCLFTREGPSMTYPVFFASKSAARVSEEASDLSDRQSQEQDQHKLHTRGEYYRTYLF
jgi:hypothetical protein